MVEFGTSMSGIKGFEFVVNNAPSLDLCRSVLNTGDLFSTEKLNLSLIGGVSSPKRLKMCLGSIHI